MAAYVFSKYQRQNHFHLAQSAETSGTLVCVEISSIKHITVTSSRCHGEQLEDQWDICVWCVEMSSINHVTVTSSRCHGEPLGELCSPHRNVNKARREWSRGRGRMKIVRPRPEMSHELPYMKACAPT